jgi:REP element-mobilizing transposase RayT
MPNTYTQIYIQIVFAVQGRQNLITEEIRDKLEKYICGIISQKKSKPLAIYCNPDHTHILIGLHPTISISDIARDIKANSSKWINESNFISGKFNWQEGFGAFSYSKSQIDGVIKYILNQPIHHKRSSFKDEYIDFLKRFNIEFDEKYLFKWIDR